MRRNSGIIGPLQNPSRDSASGIFNQIDQQTLTGGNKWPAVINSDFSITPSVNNTLEWDFSIHGTLDANTYGEYTIVANRNVDVIVKMRGAGGARGYNYGQGITSTSEQGDGGGGGFSQGAISFLAGNTYVLQIGQGGIRSNNASNGASYIAGGIGKTSTTYGGTQGGGYTGIFRTVVSQANSLIIAGGGGAGGATSVGGVGGAGGGSSGAATSSGSQGGGGGSQSAGGSASSFNGATAGSALTGGVAQKNATSQASLGGGGGGYFGGGGGNVGGGGGGSGRLGTTANGVVGGTTTVGSGAAPGVIADSDMGNLAGRGGNAAQGTSGADGRVKIYKAVTSSLYFDGGRYFTTDNATVPSAYTLGSGDFTIEFWFNGAAQVNKFFYCNRQGLTSTNPHVTTGGIGGTGTKLRWGTTNTHGTITIADSSWHHCAISRQSSNLRLWVDGVLDTYATDNNNYSTDRNINIGRNSFNSDYLTGYLSNFRVIKGTAIYTSNFTPPLSTLTAVSNTALLVSINQLWDVDFSSNRFKGSMRASSGNDSTSPAQFSTSTVPF